MHTFEAFSIIDNVNKKFGSTELGRISQILLALCFIEAGYKVPTMQLSGRPDIVAYNENYSLVVEVKTSGKPEIQLKKEDLRGVGGPKGSKPLIAVLSYPEVNIYWILADASKLSAGTYLKSSLEYYRNKDIQDEINKYFFNVIEKNQLYITQGTNRLLQLFREVQNRQ